MALMTLAQAKAHLRIDTTADDVDLALKMAHASALIVARCTNQSVALAWIDTTAPDRPQAAALKVLASLWEHRGDDGEALDDNLWMAVDRLLIGYRDPVLA